MESVAAVGHSTIQWWRYLGFLQLGHNYKDSNNQFLMTLFEINISYKNSPVHAVESEIHTIGTRTVSPTFYYRFHIHFECKVE